MDCVTIDGSPAAWPVDCSGGLSGCRLEAEGGTKEYTGCVVLVLVCTGLTVTVLLVLALALATVDKLLLDSTVEEAGVG